MLKKIENEINNFPEKYIRIDYSKKIIIDLPDCMTLSSAPYKGLINVTRSHVTIDGRNSIIDFEISNSLSGNFSLFYIHPQAKNIEFKNFKIKILVQNKEDSIRSFAIFCNAAQGLKLTNCSLELYSNRQLNLSGIYNYGNIDTNLEARTDNLVINNCCIKINVLSEEYTNPCLVYGIYNHFSNSISIQNNYIYAINKGNSANQKAIGIFTNGRFGRFIGNNIKANADYPEGFELNHACAIGFVNEGPYSIISNNNIVAEWAGCAIGLENKGEYGIINANKILSTHTICGKSIKNSGDKANITDNMIISTSRNAKLIEHKANNSIISHNFMEVLMPEQECKSGCGIYAIGGNLSGNIITENVIHNVLNCGIFADRNVGILSNNQVISFGCTKSKASSDDIYLLEKLNEKNIRSIKKKMEEEK